MILSIRGARPIADELAMGDYDGDKVLLVIVVKDPHICVHALMSWLQTVRMYACMHACMHAHIHVCMCMYAQMHVCMYAFMSCDKRPCLNPKT